MSPSGFSRVGLCIYIFWLCVLFDLPTTDGRHQQQQQRQHLEKRSKMKSVVDQMPRDIRELITAQQQSSRANVVNSIPVHIITGTSEGVVGITSLGRRLYVAWEGSQHLDVYNINDYTPSRQIRLPRPISSLASIAASAANNCIYMSEYHRDVIYRVDLSSSNTVASWNASDGPMGIDVMTNGNVLVASTDAHKIQEYTADGQLVGELLVPGLPWFVIQLPGELLGVTIFDAQQSRYCVLRSDGSVVKCHGGAPGSGINQLYYPSSVAVDKHGTAYVADYWNNRIVMLEPDTLSASILPVEGGITRPWSVHLDTSRGRLYIGESNGRRRVVVLAV